jgi:hypothetical protein
MKVLRELEAVATRVIYRWDRRARLRYLERYGVGGRKQHNKERSAQKCSDLDRIAEENGGY